MQDIYRDALAEVDKILDFYYDESVKLIPESFRKFIKENKTYNYKFNLDRSLSLREQHILPETEVILTIIYMDFMATEEEKQELLNKQKINKINLEEEKRKLYNPDDLFKK